MPITGFPMDLFNQYGTGSMPKEVWLGPIFDPHLHGRGPEDGRLHMILEDCIHHYSAACFMGNDGAINTAEKARGRIASIKAMIPKQCNMQVLCAPVINDTSDAAEIIAGFDAPYEDRVVHAVKIFFRGVSLDLGNSVSNVQNIAKLIKLSTGPFNYAEHHLPITLHAERKRDRDGNELNMEDREYYCVTTDVIDILAINPRATIILRHVSDVRTIDLVKKLRGEGADIHVEICPQYLMMTTSRLFEDNDGGTTFQAHCLCWPLYKGEDSRKALVELALSGEEWVHFGSDRAVHLDNIKASRGVKVTYDGEVCGGLTFPTKAAVSSVISLFARRDKLHSLSAFMGTNGAKVYGVTLPSTRTLFEYHRFTMPDYMHGFDASGNRVRARTFLAGRSFEYQLVLI